MSIIYEALKKSQRARTQNSQPGTRTKALRLPMSLNRRKQMFMVLLILTCLFVIAATLMLPPPSKVLLGQNDRPLKALPLQAPASAPRLLLEGVFLSDKEKLAMINHKAYHEGDLINGMQVVSIAFDQVTLQNKARSLTLRSAMTQFD